MNIRTYVFQEDSEDLSRRLAEQEEIVATLRTELRNAAEDDAVSLSCLHTHIHLSTPQ